ncbi:MAG: hypothetical protein IT435_05670 [Phycisphaerales bacterium]|nr:hypothetical protein [Phycisphaerales bacterium]
MADIVWPVSLPQVPQLSPLDRQLGRMVIRTEMDAGPAVIRRRFTFAPERFNIALDMTAAQVATFVQFRDETSEGGALAFDWKHPTLRTDATLRFTSEPSIKPQATVDSTKPVYLVTFGVETVAPALEPLIEPATGPDFGELAEHTYDDDALGADAGVLDSRVADDGTGVDPVDDGGDWDLDFVNIVSP